MKPKKILLMIALGMFIFLAISNVSAVQKKMAIEECLMSYNDDTYGPWDEANHSGVFVKVINHNLNLGASESADYEYINYQTNNPLNTMPILNIEPGKPNMLYTKCTQKVGDYRIYFQNYIVPYQGDGQGLHMSPDFNFNNGVTVETGFTGGTSPAYNGVASTFQHYQYNLKLSPHGTVYYADNGASSGYDADATAIYQEGFFPNTHPVMMTKINLTNYPSGVLWGYSLIREAGYVMLIDAFWNKFYLNSSTENIEDFLAAKVVTGGSMTNLDNPNKLGASTTNTLTCTEAANDCFDLSQGGKMQMTYQFRNIFSVPLSNLEVRNVWTTSASRKGFGRPGTEVSYFTSPVEFETISDIPAFTTVSYTFERDIPLNNNYIWANTHGYIMFRNIFGDYAQAQYFRPGDDGESLLGFRNFDPRIGMQKEFDKYTPIFNLTVSLTTANTRYNYEEVFPGDFDLVYEVSNGSDVKDSYIVAGADVFSDMGVASMPQGAIGEYNFILPIKEEYAAESAGGANYYVHVYVVSRNGGKFDGLKIATTTRTPYFSPGDVSYQLDNRLVFGSDSRVDSKKILLFNPTFYENDIDLSVKDWSDNDNFSLSWDGVNYAKDASTTVHLYPLQSKEITFWVNSTYDPWIDSPVLENLTININAVLETGGEDAYKSVDFDYILDVSNDSLNWVNINPLGYDPSEISLDTLNSTRNEEIILRWEVQGSNSALAAVAGQNYTVNISLINNSDGSILKSLPANFSVVSGVAELRFNYIFSYGDYSLSLDLDSSDELAENFSSGSNAETDNYKLYALPVVVTGCWYAADGYMHLINFFGDNVQDTYNKCECPVEFITVPDYGYCADPNFDGCSLFTVFGECNDWNETLPGICGWEVEVAPSPPNPIDGNCLGCNNISNMCSGYNNKETCDADPCFKAAIYDCGILGCDENEAYGCVWDTDNICKFQGSIGGTSCMYEGEAIQECADGVKKMIVNFTSVGPSCPDKQRSVACPQDIIAMSFFTTFNLISAIVLITLFYVGREFFKK